MVIDNELIFDTDADVSASFKSAKVVDLGKNGAVLSPLDIMVTLATKMTSGSIDTVTVETSVDEAFTDAITEAAYTVAKSVDQTAGPCTLAHFKSPIAPQARYVRLSYAGTTPVGGKVTAFLTQDAAHNTL